MITILKAPDAFKIDRSRIITFDTSHHIDYGQYPLTEYVETQMVRWASHLFQQVIVWCENNYPDTEIFYIHVLNSLTMEYKVKWCFKLPSEEAKVHFKLSDIPFGGVTL